MLSLHRPAPTPHHRIIGRTRTDLRVVRRRIVSIPIKTHLPQTANHVINPPSIRLIRTDLSRRPFGRAILRRSFPPNGLLSLIVDKSAIAAIPAQLSHIKRPRAVIEFVPIVKRRTFARTAGELPLRLKRQVKFRRVTHDCHTRMPQQPPINHPTSRNSSAPHPIQHSHSSPAANPWSNQLSSLCQSIRGIL